MEMIGVPVQLPACEDIAPGFQIALEQRIVARAVGFASTGDDNDVYFR